MNRYAYRIHYQEDPKRIGHIPMNGDEVHAALRRFRDALPQYLRELNASAEMPEAVQRHHNAIRVLIHTDRDWAQASRAMAAYADRHGLRATHVLRSQASLAGTGTQGVRAGSWLLGSIGGSLAAGS